MIEIYDRILDNNIILNENDQKQIDYLLQECLNITENMLNKNYNEEFINVIEELADKISKIRCFVNPVYKQICDDVEKAMSKAKE